MSENEPALPPETDVTTPIDLQLAPNGEAGAAGGKPPDLGLPTRSIAQPPRWPHPNFGWALLWCLFFWVITQIPAAFVVAVVVIVLAIVSPDTLPKDALNDPKKLYETYALNLGLALGQFFSEILVVGFSWLVIRLVVGRDWMRQLAVRLPSLTHTLLALVSLPAFALLGNVVYELMRASGRVPSISDADPLQVCYFWIAMFAVLGVVLLAAWMFAGSGWSRRLAARPARPVDFLVAAVALPLLLFCALGLYEAMRWAFHVPGMESVKLGGMEEAVKIFAKWPWPFAVLVIGLGPGIGEELWCRGFLGRGLVGSHGVVLGVLASSFFFGLIHVDPCQGMMAMAMGVCLHFVYLTTRSLLLPMLLHFLNNSFAVLEPRFPQLALVDAKPADIHWSIYASSALLLVAAIYALWQSRPRLAPGNAEPLLVWQPAYQGVEYPPADSGIVVVHPLPSLRAAALAVAAFVLFILACANVIRGG